MTISGSNDYYLEFLHNSQLMPKTQDIYTNHHNLWKKINIQPYPNETEDQTLQRKISAFMSQRPYTTARAFIKHYVRVYAKKTGNYDIVVRKQRKNQQKAPLSLEEINTYISQYQGKQEIRDKLMLKILFITGSRRNELINIRIKDIDWDKSTIRIIKGKGNKVRTQGIPSSVLPEMKGYLESLSPEQKQPQSRLFPITPRRLQQIVNKATQGKAHTHLLRASAATFLLWDKQWNIIDVKEFLGHEDIKTTQNYTRIVDRQKVIQKAQESFQ